MKIREYAETRKQSQNNVRQVVYRMAKDPQWSSYIIHGDTREGYDLKPEAVAELDRHYLKSVKLSFKEYNDMKSKIEQTEAENERLKKRVEDLTDLLLGIKDK